jgi:WD40 repeat protein
MKLLNLFFLLITLFSHGITNAQSIDVITQEQSKGAINKLTYSPNGKLIASGSESDAVIKIWDIKSGKIIGKLDAHENTTTAFEFNLDGTKIISTDKDNKLIIWDLITWSITDSITAKKSINEIIFTSANSFITGNEKGEVHQWKTDNLLSSIELLNCGNSISQLAVNKTNLVIGCFSGSTILYDLKLKKIIQEQKTHSGKVIGIKFYNNGEKLLTAGEDGKLIFWNIKEYKPIKELKASNSNLTAFDANYNKNIIVVGNKNKEVILFNFESQQIQVLETKNTESNLSVNTLALSPDGSSISSSHQRAVQSIFKKEQESYVQIWDLTRGSVYKTLKGSVNPIYSFDFHPVLNRLITLGADRKVTLWDFEVADKIGDFTLIEPKREIPPKRKQITLKKGKKFLNIATSIANGNIPTTEIKKTGTKVTSAVLKRSFKEKSIIKYSSKGSYLITKIKKDEIRLYDLKDRKPEYIKPLFSYQGNINNILCSPDETKLIVLGSGDSAISIINLETGDFIKKLSTPAPKGKLRFAYEAISIAFSPDGKFLAVCFNTGKTFVYNTTYWELVFENPLPNNLGYVQGAFVNFSENGEYIIINTMVGIVKYNIKNYAKFDGGILKTKGTSIPLDKPSDYAATVHENYLYFENTVNAEIIKSIKVSANNISHISVKNNGKMGITLLSGQFLLINPKTGETDILLVANGDNYIIKTHENFYKVSKEGFELVTFRLGNEAYPFEQFDMVFNRPDLVLTKLKSNDKTLIDLYKKAFDKRMKKLGLEPTTAISLNSIPKCSVSNYNKIPAFTKNKSVDLTFNLSDTKLIQSYNIWVNNVPVHGKKGKIINKKTYTNTDKVELVYGTNKIQIACRNSDGYESLMETIYVENNGEKPTKNLYLVTIGASKYENSKYDLTYPEKDAKDLTHIMTSNVNNNYTNVKTKSLYDNEITVENVLKLKEFLNESSVNDVVIVFVAGHGVLDANFDYFFATYNMDFNAPQGKGLAYEDLESIIDGIKAKRKILIMDTCHSGEVDEEEVFFSEEDEVIEEDISFRAAGPAVKTDETKASASKIMNELFNDLRRGTGATVISSAGGAEYAMESDEWKNGLFTYCLLMGLKNGKADLNEDGQIKLTELQTYVTEKVKRLSHGKQVPNSRIHNLELDFRIW